eukprot:gene41071-54408_t
MPLRLAEIIFMMVTSQYCWSTAYLNRQFIEFSIQAGVLRFGEFVTKAGRLSPYFFNAGLFNDGASLGKLAAFYAQTMLDSGVEFDMLFGPAYKGITLASATAVAMAAKGRNVPFAYNRKEAKDHGEGGSLVGAPLQGRVLIVDDVMSAGTAVRESIALIQAAGATPHAVVIALDRQEMATEKQPDGNTLDVPYSAVQYVRQQLGLQVCAIAELSDLLAYLAASAGDAPHSHLAAVQAYRDRYGVRLNCASYDHLAISAMARIPSRPGCAGDGLEAVATAQIEGETLQVLSVRASAARRLGLDAGPEQRDARTEATLDVLQAALLHGPQALTHETLW